MIKKTPTKKFSDRRRNSNTNTKEVNLDKFVSKKTKRNNKRYGKKRGSNNSSWGNSKSYKNKARNGYHNKKRQPLIGIKKQINFPDENTPRIILLDNEDFYGLTLEMVMFNFNLQNYYQIGTYAKLIEFINKFGEKEVKLSKQAEYIFLVDQLFEAEKTSIKELIDRLKNEFPNSRFLALTTFADGEISNKDLFEKVIVKSSRSQEQTLIKTISDLLGIEFIEDNSDPELDYE